MVFVSRVIMKKCEFCGGIIIYPLTEEIKYRKIFDGWLCDDCFYSLKQSMFQTIRENKQNKKVVNKRKK